MKIIIGSVLKGFKLKAALTAYLVERGHEVIDVGCYGADRFVKYTSIAERVARALQEGFAPLAICLCGSGTGVGMAANKFTGVIAGICESVKTATLCRIISDANCLCMGEDIVTESLACEMAEAFIKATFQDNPNVTPEIREFWKEARDEMFAKGVPARNREIEML